MDILILRTSIDNKNDFRSIDNFLSSHYNVDECTIDLEDHDKVLRIIGSNLDRDEVITRVNEFGFECSELPD